MCRLRSSKQNHEYSTFTQLDRNSTVFRVSAGTSVLYLWAPTGSSGAANGWDRITPYGSRIICTSLLGVGGDCEPIRHRRALSRCASPAKVLMYASTKTIRPHRNHSDDRLSSDSENAVE